MYKLWTNMREKKYYFKIWTLTNALKTHLYRHELQQAKVIVTSRCPSEKLITTQKGTKIHKNRKRENRYNKLIMATLKSLRTIWPSFKKEERENTCIIFLRICLCFTHHQEHVSSPNPSTPHLLAICVEKLDLPSFYRDYKLL